MPTTKKREGPPPPPPAKLRPAGRRCTICCHPKRTAIDAALIARDMTLRDLASAFEVGTKSLERHRMNHLPTDAMAAGAAAAVAGDADHGGDLVKTAIRYLGEADALLLDAKNAQDRTNVARALREARGLLETIGKLQGTIDTGITLNLAVSPALTEMQSLILAALSSFPEARMAVIHALTSRREVPMLEHSAVDADHVPVSHA
jgi:hypothetical protein